MRFIINPHGHYFVVSENVDMSDAPYPGCQHLNSEAEMLDVVSAKYGVDREDLEGSSMVISVSPETGGLICTEDRGISVEVKDLKAFIVEFVL